MDELNNIEHLREHLYRLVEECRGDLLHPLVLQASQALDAAITRLTHLRKQPVNELHIAV